MDKRAFYFGCWNRPGHFLHNFAGRVTYWPELEGLPWTDGLLDGGLLKNGGHPDKPDGRVFWTVGGYANDPARLWHAFFWWDRSVDGRGESNSGFYVRGFAWKKWSSPVLAFAYACEQFPHVVKRQRFPLQLQLDAATGGTEG